MDNELVAWLRRWLEEKGWSQNQLAEASGLKSGPMSRIMNGGRLSPEMAKRLGPVVNLDANVLLVMNGRLPAQRGDVTKNPRLAELVNLFMQMDDEGQEDELATLRARVERRKKGRHGRSSPASADT